MLSRVAVHSASLCNQSEKGVLYVVVDLPISIPLDSVVKRSIGRSFDGVSYY
jgi:hypothetical protein